MKEIIQEPIIKGPPRERDLSRKLSEARKEIEALRKENAALRARLQEQEEWINSHL
jgi:predicted  nucleic acid-binding Zn-ribbon protein